MRILAIETSCDETSAAVVEDGVRVLCNVIASSKDAFGRSGGVIPEQAARAQVECMQPVLEQALQQASASPQTLDCIAVTKGPGLLGSLLVGTTTARVLASVWEKPLVGVHHNFGHLSSTWLQCTEVPSFPILTLSVSGGHTELWYRTSHTRGSLLGRTRDDAAGEAFDKGAALLGLPYPGGPAISTLAEAGDASSFDFPLPLHGEKSFDFSYSGLKTSLKYLLRDLDTRLTTEGIRLKADVAASYQHAICRHLIDRLLAARTLYPETQEIHIVGGVSANTHLRQMLRTTFSDITLRHPSSFPYCTDNAAMIGAGAYFEIQENGQAAFSPFETAASIPLSLSPA